MALVYPFDTVWYVEGHNAYGQVVTSGSAVAVRLRHGDDPAETYLLTCSHVVRGLSSDRQKGHGEILSSIKVWPPGRGFDDDDGIAAHIQQDAKATDLNDVPVDKRLNVTDDWLLLRIDDDTRRRGADTVVWADEVSAGQSVAVFGYPAGRASISDTNVVVPTKAPQDITVRSESSGVVQLTGSATEPGMSGGGIFDEHGNFVGLHRAKYAGAIQLHGVYAPKIRQWLSESDYLVVTEAPRLPDAEEADTEQTDGLASGTLREQPDDPMNWRKLIAWISASVLVVGGLIAAIPYLIPDNPDIVPVEPTSQTTHVRLNASLLTIGESGFVKERTPLSNAKISIHPSSFDALRIVPTLTDENGDSIVEIDHPPLTSQQQLKGHFVVLDVPDELEGDSPYATTEHGAVMEGESLRMLRMTPRVFADGEQIELQVVPEKDIPRFYLASVAPSLADDPSGNPVYTTSSHRVFADIQQTEADATLALWSEILKRQRPVLGPDDLERADEWKNIESLQPLLNSVCYATDTNRPELTYLGTGFVVAKDTVIVASYSEPVDQIGVGLSMNPSDEGHRVFPVSDVLFRSHDLQVAVLDVPGIETEPLTLLEKNPFIGDQSSIAVLGYPAIDHRLPPEVNELFNGRKHRLSIMPGKLLGFRSKEEFGSTKKYVELTYDATTAGGVGGAPVVDLASGAVAGIHLTGKWSGERKIGGAVPTWALLEDEELAAVLRDRGAKFATPARVNDAAFALGGNGYDSEFLSGGTVPLPLPKERPEKLEQLKFDYPHFTVVMNPRHALAWYTACNIDRSDLKRISRARFEFVVDSRGGLTLQRTNEYYNNNEWDRGHLVSSSSVAWGTIDEATKAKNAAYAFTNITPQYMTFNQGVWLNLEDAILSDLEPDSNRISVFSGPVFSEDDPVYRGFTIPQAFWKIAVFAPRQSGERRVLAWIIPQFDTSNGVAIPFPREREFAEFETTVEAVEQATYLVFRRLD
ncbi:Hypothetical protein PBC10988_35020 [Planctomycetales bacterium 10988]|nr:Hypothetical protein PBC10988_35020 [Planctomycetales bacterium 10988]